MQLEENGHAQAQMFSVYLTGLKNQPIHILFVSDFYKH